MLAVVGVPPDPSLETGRGEEKNLEKWRRVSGVTNDKDEPGARTRRREDCLSIFLKD